MKKGLILEGGAMRGMFTAGVMDVLMEHQIEFDGVIGVSAGAAFGCNYKSGQIGRVLRYNTRFCADKRYGGVESWLKTGNIYNTEFCYGEVPLKHDPFDFAAYDRSLMEFYVVCTDIETGLARGIIDMRAGRITVLTGFGHPLPCRWSRKRWKLTVRSFWMVEFQIRSR